MFDKGTLERKITVVASVLIGFLLVGTLFFHSSEGWSYLNSAYFSVVTLSTIGYGDLVPKQDITKIFLIFYIVFGVSAVLYGFTTIGSYYLDRHDEIMRNTFVSVREKGARIQIARKKFGMAREEFRKGVLGREKGRKKSRRKRAKNPENSV